MEQNKYPEVKNYTKIRRVTSGKTGQEFIVTSIIQEVWKPVSYYEKVMYGGEEKIRDVVEEKVQWYDKKDKVYPRTYKRRGE